MFFYFGTAQNGPDPISMVVMGQQPSSSMLSPSAAAANNRGVVTSSSGVIISTERNYERIDPNEASMLTSSLAVTTAILNTPRLVDAKEQKRRDKEMRRLAKLRIEAEIKEAKLQAKLAKKQAKRGEPVAIGILHNNLRPDGIKISK